MNKIQDFLAISRYNFRRWLIRKILGAKWNLNRAKGKACLSAIFPQRKTLQYESIQQENLVFEIQPGKHFIGNVTELDSMIPVSKEIGAS